MNNVKREYFYTERHDSGYQEFNNEILKFGASLIQTKTANEEPILKRIVSCGMSYESDGKKIRSPDIFLGISGMNNVLIPIGIGSEPRKIDSYEIDIDLLIQQQLRSRFQEPIFYYNSNRDACLAYSVNEMMPEVIFKSGDVRLNDSGIIFDGSRNKTFLIHHDIDMVVYAYEHHGDKLLNMDLGYWDGLLEKMIERSVNCVGAQPIMVNYLSIISDRVDTEKARKRLLSNTDV